MTEKVEKVEKKGRLSGGETPKLTSTQHEILHLLTDEFMTPRKIAIRRGTSDKATYKTIAKLKKMGLLSRTLQGVEKNRCTIQPLASNVHEIRLHGEEWNIKILHQDHRYSEKQKKSNVLHIDGNIVRLYNNSLEVYSGKEFCGDDVQKATARSFGYWNRFFTRLEHDLKVILVKHRAENIRIVKAHYAEVNNELAIDHERRGDHLKIYTRDDGKLWFLIDNSFNLKEAETVHSKTAMEDMQAVSRHFNDIRDHSPPTLSEIMFTLRDMVAVQKETASGLNGVVSVLKSQFPDPQPNGRGDYFG